MSAAIPRSTYRARVLLWCAFASNVIAFPFAMTMSWGNPPVAQPTRWPAMLFCAAAFVAAIVASAADRSLLRRVVAGMSICWTFLFFLGPTLSFYYNYHDFEWATVLPFLLFGVGGCLAVRQYVPGIALAGLACIAFVPALLPPSAEHPRILKQDGLMITIDSSHEMHIQVENGAEPDTLFDLDHVDLRGQIGWLIPVDGWHASRFYDGTAESMGRFWTHVFPPKWARSFDLTVSIPRWPKSPSARVRIPLPGKQVAEKDLAHSYSDASGGVSLTVSRVHWGESFPDPGQLALDLRVDLSGTNERDLRITDDLGHAATLWVNRIEPIDPKAKFLNIDAFSEEALQANEHTFVFARVPTPNGE